MALHTGMQDAPSHGESTVHSVARCEQEEGLRHHGFCSDYTLTEGWSQQMLIGCLGTEKPKQGSHQTETVIKTFSLKMHH